MSKDYPDKPSPQGRQKRSLLDIIKERLKEKPATKEEIKQLKLDFQKAKLEAGIAKAKKQKRESKRSFGSMFGSVSDSKSSPRRTKHKRHYDDSNEEKGMSARDVKKAFWG